MIDLRDITLTFPDGMSHITPVDHVSLPSAQGRRSA